MGESAPLGGDTRARRRFYLFWGAVVLVVIVAFRAVLTPFLLGLLVAYVLAPVVSGMERVDFRGKRLSRPLAVIVLYLGLLTFLSLSIANLAPRVAGEVQRLTFEMPRIAQSIDARWMPRVREVLHRITATLGSLGPGASTTAVGVASSEITVTPQAEGGFRVALPSTGILVSPTNEGGYEIRSRHEPRAQTDDVVMSLVGRVVESGQDNAGALIRTAQAFVLGLTRGVFVFSLTVMLSAYLLISQRRIFDFARGLVPIAQHDNMNTLVRLLDRGLSGVVRGQLLICVVNGVLSGIGFYILGLKYWFALTLIATVFSIIPIFGAILSSVPAVAIGLQQSPTLALLVLGWILLIHQIEANFLNPKIMGDAARVHPVMVVFALLAGEHAFGVLGALLAVPVLSITQSFFLFSRSRVFGGDPMRTIPPQA